MLSIFVMGTTLKCALGSCSRLSKTWGSGANNNLYKMDTSHLQSECSSKPKTKVPPILHLGMRKKILSFIMKRVRNSTFKKCAVSCMNFWEGKQGKVYRHEWSVTIFVVSARKYRCSSKASAVFFVCHLIKFTVGCAKYSIQRLSPW